LILQLKKSIEFSSIQNKIELPTVDIHDGDSAIIAGWGMVSSSSYQFSEILRQATMTIMHAYKCKQYINLNLFDEQICAYSVRYGIHTGSVSIFQIDM
jgi:hypothetical protein